ncbi:MAG TPA: winged helix-turn-helix domain-containing protein [Bryobacteraceae bacterium]|nr:winged helix-turn-helix domain-containing protein [Bryobacteraceae bacterium]
MGLNFGDRAGWEGTSRTWRFDQYEFDEASRELRAGGRPLELESKPLEVLYQLLLHAGEVVTKDELLESAWPGVSVVEGSLATAVSKLRKSLADDDARIILTVPRVGYRLAVPVQCRIVTPPATEELAFKPGDPVPGREHWQFVSRMEMSASSEVWLAKHPKTHESRVFKFASDGIRLKALKREVTLSRMLREALGERPDFVRVLEWNFDAPPFYIESEFCGQNLAEWADAHGGLRNIPLPTRLEVLIEAAQAVAAAHDTGILHKDLKPANVLITESAEGHQVKVADFGSGALMEPARLKALGITNLGFTRTAGVESGALTGTLMYLAPEVLGGQAPTASADVFALGVMLYQLIAGDFRKPLSPGWEAEVEDPLIREDIGEAACGDPSRRLISVAALVDRLRNLENRRAERNQLELARERAQIAERRLAAARARRPWVAAAALLLAAGLAISLALYRSALRERDRANRQTSIAASVNRFLADDLLGRSDPFQSGRSDETLIAAVKRASSSIDQQFHSAPDVAARLHQTIANALDNRSVYPDARAEYQLAADLFVKAGGAMSQEAIVARLQSAAMEARSYQAGSLPRARSIVAEQESRIGKIRRPNADLAVWLASARGMIALIDNNAKLAAGQFQLAYEAAERLTEFNESARLNMKQKLAFASIRMGDGAKAEQLFRELIDAFSRTSGPESPSVLRVRLNLAQAFMIEGKNKEAIQETSAIYPVYVERLGADHELSMQVLTTQAQCEGTLGLWNDAIRDDLAIHQIALRKQGPTSFFSIATLSDAALAQCRAAKFSQGESNARDALEQSIKAFGEHAGLTGAAAYTVASCWIGTGKLREASRLLEGIDSKPVAQLAGFPDWWANVSLAQAEIAYRQGDFPAARKYLQDAMPVFSRADAEPYQKRTMETLTAALKNR